jgi:hypothetical protein
VGGHKTDRRELVGVAAEDLSEGVREGSEGGWVADMNGVGDGDLLKPQLGWGDAAMNFHVRALDVCEHLDAVAIAAVELAGGTDDRVVKAGVEDGEETTGVALVERADQVDRLVVAETGLGDILGWGEGEGEVRVGVRVRLTMTVRVSVRLRAKVRVRMRVWVRVWMWRNKPGGKGGRKGKGKRTSQNLVVNKWSSALSIAAPRTVQRLVTSAFWKGRVSVDEEKGGYLHKAALEPELLGRARDTQSSLLSEQGGLPGL